MSVYAGYGCRGEGKEDGQSPSMTGVKVVPMQWISTVEPPSLGHPLTNEEHRVLVK